MAGMFGLLSLLSCSSAPEPQPAPPRPEPGVQPDVVLVLLSGLREDGSAPPATETLIAAVGTPAVRFTAAYSQSVNPYISAGSLLTGRYPAAIPICSRPQQHTQQEDPFCMTLPERTPTIPEVMGLYGYSSALVTVNSSDLQPLARGVDAHLESRSSVPDQAWSEAVVQAQGWWQAHTDTPRLLIVAGDLHTQGLESAIVQARSAHLLSEADRDIYRAEHPDIVSRFAPGMPWPILADSGRALIHAAYDTAAGQVGAQVAELLGGLAPAERPQWTAITALHGMTLGESTGCRSPEQLSPGSHIVLLDRTLRVPLLLYGPEPVTRTIAVDHPVELLDLMPTLATLAGAVLPAALPGADLLPQITAPGEEEIAYAEFGDMLALRYQDTLLTFRSQIHGINSADPRLTERLLQTAPRSLVGAVHSAPVGGGRGAYYEFLMHEVTTDPLQTTPLPVGDDQPRFMALVARLLAQRAGPAAPPTAALSWEEIRQLHREGVIHYW